METGKEALASTTAAIGSLGGGSATPLPLTGAENSKKAAVPYLDAKQAAVPAVSVANSLLLQRVETLISKADKIISSDTLKAKGYIEKYWPIAAGMLIAVTRLLH